DLGHLQTVRAEDRADVRAMVAPVMRELRHEDPCGDPERRIACPPAALVANDAVGIELRPGEEPLHTLPKMRQVQRDLVERGVRVGVLVKERRSEERRVGYGSRAGAGRGV